MAQQDNDDADDVDDHDDDHGNTDAASPVHTEESQLTGMNKKDSVKGVDTIFIKKKKKKRKKRQTQRQRETHPGKWPQHNYSRKAPEDGPG